MKNLYLLFMLIAFDVLMVSAIPGTPAFSNFGGSTQLAFNNAAISTTQPVFSLSTSSGTSPNLYSIEINTASDFSGTSWVQTFAGTYVLSTQYNFTFTNSFIPVDGTTYYVRAEASSDGGTNYSGYTSGTYSFTYIASGTPYWFQDVQPQWLTDALSGDTAESDNTVQVTQGVGGVNAITNPSFESGNLTSWTASVVANPSGSIRTAYYVGVATAATNYFTPSFNFTPPSPSPVTDGTYAMVMCNEEYGFSETTSGGDYIVAQTGVDLTGVSTISFSQTFSDWAIGGCSGGVYSVSKLEVIIDAGNSSTGTAGTVVYTSATWTGACLAQYTTVSSGPAVKTITLPNGTYGSNCSVKFVWVTLTDAYSTFADAPTCYVDNVQASSGSGPGAIISTPVYLASIQGAASWSTLTWDQTLNGGSIVLRIQKIVSGTWTDAAGLYSISSSSDGINMFDISSLGATGVDSIRIFAVLAQSGATSPSLNSWSITPDIISTGLSEPAHDAGVEIYPNPVSECSVSLSASKELMGAEYCIFDVSGKIIARGIIKSEKSEIDVADFTPGVYLLRIMNSDKLVMRKMVKE